MRATRLLSLASTPFNIVKTRPNPKDNLALPVGLCQHVNLLDELLDAAAYFLALAPQKLQFALERRIALGVALRGRLQFVKLALEDALLRLRRLEHFDGLTQLLLELGELVLGVSHHESSGGGLAAQPHAQRRECIEQAPAELVHLFARQRTLQAEKSHAQQKAVVSGGNRAAAKQIHWTDTLDRAGKRAAYRPLHHRVLERIGQHEREVAFDGRKLGERPEAARP